MKVFAAALLILSMLCGCNAKDDTIKQATDLRSRLLSANACTFDAVITADYGDKIHTFQLECTVDRVGNLSFTVISPESISGITGQISQDGAKLTFYDNVLAFPMLADGEISPVCSPWLFMNALRGGYISGCSSSDTGLCIYIDDSFRDRPIQLEISTDKDAVPNHIELVWQNNRILSLDVQDFVIQ